MARKPRRQSDGFEKFSLADEVMEEATAPAEELSPRQRAEQQMAEAQRRMEAKQAEMEADDPRLVPKRMRRMID